MERRYDIDWLRIAAVLLLIPFHTARVFNADEDFYVKNDPVSVAAQRFIEFVGPWHMSLLFLLAGAATWLAFSHRGAGQYAGERFKRLLVPFLFGVPVIVLPQTWLAYRWHGRGDISYWDYVPKFFTTTTDGTLDGYRGGFTPGHLWFILFLFVFALVALPVFVWLRRGGGTRVVSAFGRMSEIPGLLLLVPAALLVLPWYLMGDDLSGQPPIGFLLVILLGFVLVGDERTGRTIEGGWRWMLVVGLAASLIYIWAEPRAGDLWDTAVGYAGLKLLYEVGVWGVILGLLGLGHRYLQKGGRALRYATEAAYPFYILHQTVIVAVAYIVCGWGWPSALKFTVIAVASLLFSLAVYEVAVRRWQPVRFLFGMKGRRPVAGAPPAPPIPAASEPPPTPSSLSV